MTTARLGRGSFAFIVQGCREPRLDRCIDLRLFCFCTEIGNPCRTERTPEVEAEATMAGGKKKSINGINAIDLLVDKLIKMNPVIYLVPIKPNSKNWVEPDFKKIGTAYAKKWGYAHEEWNNSTDNEFKMYGKTWQAFETQGIWKDSENFEGKNIALFFLSSSKGVFNGIAINPVQNNIKEKRCIAKLVHLKARGAWLWNEIHSWNSKKRKDRFDKYWENKNTGWKMSFRWRALKNDFIWFDRPISLNRIFFDKKSKWGMRYDSPQRMDFDIAKKFLNCLKKKHKIQQSFEQYDPNEVENNSVKLQEGSTKKISVNAYERNSTARNEAIKAYGNMYDCDICGFNFESFYGNIGKNFIHIHHKIPLHKIRKIYKVNPAKDLVPVCPNCHAMLHRNKNFFEPYEKFKASLKMKIEKGLMRKKGK